MEGSSEGLRGEVGSSFQVVGNALVLWRISAGLGRVLGASWAAPGHLGQLLGSSWAVLGGSWALLGRLWRSWEALGRSWAALGRSWAALGRLWIALGRQVGAKMDAKRHKVDPKTLQNRSQDGTKRC